MNKRTNYKSTRRRTSKSDTPKEEKFRKTKECANDPSWYTVNGQLVKDVASINFNNPAGIEYHLDASANGSFVGSGIMSILMAPVPGYSESLSSPINIAAKNIYSWVRHQNSGHANYDSPDLMIMILAMANAYAYYGWMTRLYGIMRVYSQTNRYYGANAVRACAVDADNLLQNMANFRAYINQYAVKLSALSVPSTMSIFKRYMWMFSNMFLDEDDPKGQIYMYNPAYLYTYDEYNNAGRLVPVPLCLDATGNFATNMTYGAIVAYGDGLIGNLIGSEDINIMSGDILKAYGKENIWQLNLIPEEYAIAPIFSEEVLEQIHNTNFVGHDPLKDTTLALGWDSFNVEQDPNIGQGCLICKPLVKYGANIMGNQVIDFWKKDVTPEDVIVASRNIVSGTRWSQGFTAITGFGSEIPIVAYMFTLNPNGTIGKSAYFGNDDSSTFDTSFTSGSAGVARVSRLSYFNEHPFFQLVDYTSTAPYAERRADCSTGELSNYTILDVNDIEKMHLTAILSELAVPMLGNIVKG